NKVDRRDARPKEVLDLVYDLFIDVGAEEEELEFPVCYASGRQGTSGSDPDDLKPNLLPLLDAIVEHVPPPAGDVEAPIDLPVCDVEVDKYVGRIAVGRLEAGRLERGRKVLVLGPDGTRKGTYEPRLYVFQGMGREETDQVDAGDLVAVAGLDRVEIGDTLTDPEQPVAPRRMKIESPTLSMEFRVNDSPVAGR
ncbi:MAG: EF-Tu/IF-2/RF-3 family GTPase, partial [Planctomycetota bacterium]